MTATVTARRANIVNGINVDDLVTLVSGVQADAHNAATHWKVTSTWQGQTHSRAQVQAFHLAGQEVKRDFTIDIDEPTELGGGNAYANPQEYLLAAVNACMTVGYVALCALNGIRLDSLEIVTEGDIDLRGFLGLDDSVSPGYEGLDYTVRIKGDGTPEQFAAIHETVQATSPNYHNMARNVAMRAKLVVG